jgi:hypothetical protein
VYFWNTLTGESSWTRPDDATALTDDDSRRRPSGDFAEEQVQIDEFGAVQTRPLLTG